MSVSHREHRERCVRHTLLSFSDMQKCELRQRNSRHNNENIRGISRVVLGGIETNIQTNFLGRNPLKNKRLLHRYKSFNCVKVGYLWIFNALSIRSTSVDVSVDKNFRAITCNSSAPDGYQGLGTMWKIGLRSRSIIKSGTVYHSNAIYNSYGNVVNYSTLCKLASSKSAKMNLSSMHIFTNLWW